PIFLNMTLPSLFSIFGLEIRWYGIITALSLVIGFTAAFFP
ncbi:unnamed protein product, partial [marine sediment metagenome]